MAKTGGIQTDCGLFYYIDDGVVDASVREVLQSAPRYL